MKDFIKYYCAKGGIIYGGYFLPTKMNSGGVTSKYGVGDTIFYKSTVWSYKENKYIVSKEKAEIIDLYDYDNKNFGTLNVRIIPERKELHDKDGGLWISQHDIISKCGNYESGGKIKKIIRRNLPINKEYELIDSFYTGGIEENPMTCENCGRPIANVAIIQDAEGKKYDVGMDCAETLSSIKNSLEYQRAENDFKEASAIRKRINQTLKKHPESNISIENTAGGNIYVRVEGHRPWLGQSIEKQFFFKYLPDFKDKILNPDKNTFMPRLYDNHDFSFDFNIFRKDRYDGPKTLTIDKYTAEVSRGDKTHKTSEGKEIVNNYIMVKVYDGNKLIGEKDFYMHQDIPSTIVHLINKHEFNNFNE